MELKRWYYQCMVVNVVDGDTIDVIIDLGFSVRVNQRLRLSRINAFETRLGPNTDQKKKEIGIKAKGYLIKLLLNKSVLVETYKKGKFGRYIADLYFDNKCINDVLVTKGYAEYTEY